MALGILDWSVILGYLVFSLVIGLRYSGKAGQNLDEYFLSGRRLPWWIAGTSMVATTFAADTPLVIGGWVRDHGIWKNWLWWSFAVGGMATAFIFARYWRRGEVMTTAELAELRYGGREARILRGFLGFYHAGITNTIVLCWVVLAAAKIMDVVFGVDETPALVIACVLALSYSLVSGFWGVVMTDLVQFTTAMAGSLLLAGFAWSEVGGFAGFESRAVIGPDTLSFLPSPGPGSFLDASFWTAPLASLAVYLGVWWWAVDAVDGGGLVVQRISACRDERHGILAVLWYQIAHNALRPWPWILVALASLALLPTIEVRAPVAGVVASVDPAGTELTLRTRDGALTRVAAPADGTRDWRPLPTVAAEDTVQAGDVVMRTDSERAYPVMLSRYLPVGFLGLALASLLAAFMSTIDTHVNLAASYFVNDIYRRFLRPDRSAAHYVLAARLSSVAVLALAGLLAAQADSISKLFTFVLSFLGGVGPIYLLRWFWWRIQASTEIVAMVTSSAATMIFTFAPIRWSDGPLTPMGVLSPEGRLLLVAGLSAAAALISLAILPSPDPTRLVAFYTRVRPHGAWAPVRALAPSTRPDGRFGWLLLGIAASLVMIFGATLGIGFVLLGRPGAAAFAAVSSAAGSLVVAAALRTIRRSSGPLAGEDGKR